MKPLETLALAISALLFATSAATIPSRASTPVAGTIKGKVVFEGDVPEKKPLSISDEQSKGCCEGKDCMDDADLSLVVAEDGGVANVVVTIEIDGKKAEMPDEPLELDQKGCRFHPHIAVIPEGGKVTYLNSDGVSHNIHTYAVKNEGLNKTVSAGTDLVQSFDKAEQVKVTCDIHPWMTSYIFVTDASVWAVTGADGSFEIGGLEPGDYKLEIWHETLGKQKVEATVKPDGSSEMVEVTLGEKKKKGRRR